MASTKYGHLVKKLKFDKGTGRKKGTAAADYPAVIVAPAGLVHCPLITQRVDKPYAFSAISLNAEHQTTWLGTGKFPWEK